MIPAIVTIISIIVIALIILAAFFAKHSSWHWESLNERRGRLGENYVHSILDKAIAGTDAKLISNYMFQGQDITVQIDHLVINFNGVYVIETKNWSGLIYGNDEANEWTQYLAGGNIKHSHRNPVKQNKGHIYQLSKILPKGVPFHNVVVMAQGNTQNIQAKEVISPFELGSIINFTEHSTNKLTPAQVEKIYDILLKRELKEESSNEQHVREIKGMLADVENNICPRCKGKLVIREGKYGNFYGCSNYPKCKFIKNLE